jgi:chitinase
MTTSTVYTTKVHTVTKCPAWVDCPAGGYVTTETIPLYTTVCPVTKAASTTSKPSVTSSAETITTTVSSIYTITSCPPSVVNCPVGKVTTEIITTTYCPGAKETHPPAQGPSTFTTTSVYTISSCPPSVPNCPIGKVTTDVITSTYTHPSQTGVPSEPHHSGSVVVPPSHLSQTAGVVPKPSGSYNGTIPGKPSPVPSKEGCTGEGCTHTPPPTGGAGAMGASALAAMAGALVALMM